ncbi:OsmC family protein [Paenochrobactrum sp. BZR 588]
MEMSVEVHWEREGAVFTDKKYSRGHIWRFDGGQVVLASSSPHVIPLPYSVEANVDPEEAYIAAISSCHMLTFLGVAAAKRIVVESYTDKAVGIMEKIDGKILVSRVELKPLITYDGDKPSAELEAQLHHLAHEQCFIANSVKTDIQVVKQHN